MSARDQQVGGTHYRDMTVQPWDALESWLTPEQFIGFLIGSAIAYLARFNAHVPGKGGLQDLQKAVHYLQKAIEIEERA